VKVAIAQFVFYLPAHAKNDYRVMEVATFKQKRAVRRAVVHSADYALALLDAPEPLRNGAPTAVRNK
jgi:hypothetical protein